MNFVTTKYEAAVEAYSKSLATAMGDAYLADSDYEAAVEAYSKSLATKEDTTTYQRRAAAYLAMRNDVKVCAWQRCYLFSKGGGEQNLLDVIYT